MSIQVKIPLLFIDKRCVRYNIVKKRKINIQLNMSLTSWFVKFFSIIAWIFYLIFSNSLIYQDIFHSNLICWNIWLDISLTAWFVKILFIPNWLFMIFDMTFFPQKIDILLDCFDLDLLFLDLYFFLAIVIGYWFFWLWFETIIFLICFLHSLLNLFYANNTKVTKYYIYIYTNIEKSEHKNIRKLSSSYHLLFSCAC